MSAVLERRSGDRVAVATVLVVDDSRPTRRILRRMLERAGYRVAEAADGGEALDLCRRTVPDLLLLDLDMPVMNGPELLDALRDDEDLADIPVMLLSARTSAQDVAQGLSLGAEDYLRKPCQAVELHARIGLVLGRRTEYRSLRQTAEHADRLSLHDMLTGLANRRQLHRRHQQLLGERGGEASSGLIALDIDYFKQVNDVAGHEAGDAVLRILSRRLQAGIRDEDLLVRWGGEEFIVLAPGLGVAETEALAGRLHVAVGGAPCVIDGRAPMQITISVGWASGRMRDVEELISAADSALYQAKRLGRNRVIGGSAS